MTDARQSTDDRLARDAKALERAVRRKAGANYRVDPHTKDLHSDIATERERDEALAEVERLRQALRDMYEPINNLRGYRVRGQRHFNVHVDSLVDGLIAALSAPDASGARPFDPKVHSDKRGTVIGRG